MCNLTGVSILTFELMPKRLELLSELVPQARVIALLVNPNYANTERIIRDVQEAASAKGVQLHILEAGSESEIDAAFRNPRPTASRRARRRPRSVLRQPARAARGAGITTCRSGDLSVA
jgi:putative ABC transport system substrate-binding protein